MDADHHSFGVSAGLLFIERKARRMEEARFFESGSTRTGHRFN